MDNRTRPLNTIAYKQGAIAYWMSRDQRMEDNWALLYAQKKALENQVPLIIIFCLVKDYLNAPTYAYAFMINGLTELKHKLYHYNIPFIALKGAPPIEIPKFIKQHSIGMLITDFDPLNHKKEWKQRIIDTISIPMIEVDAHNIVPCWIASEKQEYNAFFFRKKLDRHLQQYLQDFPQLQKQRKTANLGLFAKIGEQTHWPAINNNLSIMRFYPSGEDAAIKRFNHFLLNQSPDYHLNRNNPTLEGTSRLSPYLHFGQVSAQRMALEYSKTIGKIDLKESFLDQLIVRKELSDNFCHYNRNYHRMEGFPNWALKTLEEHKNDPRDYLYGYEEFKAAKTHDSLWNAAQKQLLYTGSIHGYLRMYWGKKILEWSISPEEAISNAIALNDDLAMDGRDSNGYTGIAWCIGGVHDRPWGERRIFGKIRTMTFNGMKSKFKIKDYIQKMERLEQNSGG